jgi:hypothetical protein
MRIAVSGSHGTGKSTLVRELADRLPDFIAMDEPYYLLARRRNMCCSIAPADYLAYLAALEPSGISRHQVADTAAAMGTLGAASMTRSSDAVGGPPIVVVVRAKRERCQPSGRRIEP